jgi:hypothetical protein
LEESMRRRQIVRVVATVSALAVAGALVVGAPAGAARKTKAPGFHGNPIDVVFVHTTKPLRRVGAAPSAPARVARAARDGYDIEGKFLGRKKHNVNSPKKPASPFPTAGLKIPDPPDLPVSSSTKGLIRSWQGLDHFDYRLSDKGNQFSGEPPDQGICAGNGYVLETVNSVVQVYTDDGDALLPGQSGIPGTEPVGVSLSQFYGYPSEFDRTNFVFGPFLFDISCLYDKATNRWFHMSDSLDQELNTGDFTGNGTLELAVSKTGNPLGRWDIYRIYGTNDGQNNTPNHYCEGGPCFQDYPHISADRHGFYITTNEFDFFGPNYDGVNLYAISKRDLVAGDHAPTAMIFEQLHFIPGMPGEVFTLRGAHSRPGSFSNAKGGTAFFVSGGDTYLTGRTNHVVVWALTNTRSLNGDAPDPVLRFRVIRTIPWVFPPLALQRPGPTPLLRCINMGVDCFGEPAPFVQPGPYPLDASDGRVVGAYLERGVLWATVDTALNGAGGSDYTEENNFGPQPIDQKAGIAYFALRPYFDQGLRAEVLQQGYIGVKNANLTYPSIAMAGSGNVGFIGATMVGPDHYPSAAYVKLGLGMKPRVVRIAAAGKGPDDGFTGTWVGDFRPRWGDYGYAVPGEPGTVWIAAEYIAQKCGFAEFVTDTTCGFERTFFANWSTRVMQLHA